MGDVRDLIKDNLASVKTAGTLFAGPRPKDRQVCGVFVGTGCGLVDYGDDGEPVRVRSFDQICKAG